MATFQVRNVPDDIYDELVRQVEVSGLTFDHFVVNLLKRSCGPKPGLISLEEAFAIADKLPGPRPPAGWATAEIRRMRDAAE